MTTPVHPSDLRGISRLAIDATTGLTDLVEAMHHNLSRVPFPLGAPAEGPTRGITGLVYRSIRGVTRLLGGGVDALLAQLVPMLGEPDSTPGRDAILSVLNGVLGDHLEASGNPLAIPLRLRSGGKPLDPETVAVALPPPGGKLLLLAHGLCMSDLQWNRNGHDHSAALARDLGYTPVHLRYNSGLHVSTNGSAAAARLEALLEHWPVPIEELAMVGFSMGGLVFRSACHHARGAGHNWLGHLRKLIFLGTPHHGAPLERGGNWVTRVTGISPYTAALSRLGKIRSSGITDLRFGSLLDEDWQGRDRFEHTPDPRSPVPLPEGVQCYAIAATTGREAGDFRDRLVGDGLVPLHSALGQHTDARLALSFPESRQWIAYGLKHLDLLDREDVYGQIRSWLAS